MRYAVVMAGGSGTRFWPLSRRNTPKQFLKIGHKKTLIQETIARLLPAFSWKQILIVTQSIQLPELQKQLPDLPESNILVEPEGRDTSAAIALATLYCARRDPEATLAIMPADHVIHPPEAFLKDLDQAFLACDQSIVTLGIPPTCPHIGYGYIQRSEPITENLYHVQCFVEKPDLEKAKTYLQSGDYYWNAGIFVFQQATMMRAFQKHMPDFYAQLQPIQEAVHTPDFFQVLQQEYPKLQKISIDFGIMEKFRPLKVLATHFEWDDVGSLLALERYGTPDEANNVAYGDWLGVESEGLLVHSNEGHLVATLGLKDLAIIHTKEATLIVPKSRIEEVKKIVEKLTQEKKAKLL